jgi:hypothetical protein
MEFWVINLLLCHEETSSHPKYGRSWVRARSGKTRNYEIGIFCFSAQQAVLRRNGKDWWGEKKFLRDITTNWSPRIPFVQLLTVDETLLISSGCYIGNTITTYKDGNYKLSYDISFSADCPKFKFVFVVLFVWSNFHRLRILVLK